MLSRTYFRSAFSSIARMCNSRALHGHSTYSTGDCRVELEAGVALVTLQRSPANSFTTKFLTELTSTISSLERNADVKGVIITSGIPKMFSPGLDIFVLRDAKKDEISELWRALQEFWMKVYVSPLITVAAINGASVAGGCLLAMSCDYRIASSGDYPIGLNVALLGILPPPWIRGTLEKTIGYRQTERVVQLGHLFKTDEALKVGLVDEVVKEEDLLNVARREMEKWLKIPEKGRINTKVAMRHEMVDRLAKRLDEDTEIYINMVTQDHCQKLIGRYIENFKKETEN